MGYHVCCFSLKYGPMFLQILTIHCLSVADQSGSDEIICQILFVYMPHNLEHRCTTFELLTLSVKLEKNSHRVNIVNNTHE